MSTANLGYIKNISIYLSTWYYVASSRVYRLLSKSKTAMWLFQLLNWYQNSVSLWKSFWHTSSLQYFCVCTQTENTLSEVMQWLTQQIILSLLRLPGKQPVQLAEPVLKKISKTKPNKLTETQTSLFGIKALTYYFVPLLPALFDNPGGLSQRDIDMTAIAPDKLS